MVLEKSARVQMPVCIQRMQLEDLKRVVELDATCFPTPWSLSAYITELHNHSGYYIVARSENQVVGFAGEWLIMDEAHITTIGVDPKFQGRKIGERMLVDLLDKALEHGVQRATLEVRRSNLVAQGLYRKYGFHTVAVRKGYYTNNNEDAFVMWLDDMSDPGFQRMYEKNKEHLAESA